MFEVGAGARFRAFHCMPSQPPPENERHAHDYRVEVVAERESLDERGMVCDLGVADVCAVEVVTVEALAAWIHGQLADPLRIDGAELLAVRVWESEDAFGGMRARL